MMAEIEHVWRTITEAHYQTPSSRPGRETKLETESKQKTTGAMPTDKMNVMIIATLFCILVITEHISMNRYILVKFLTFKSLVIVKIVIDAFGICFSNRAFE